MNVQSIPTATETGWRLDIQVPRDVITLRSRQNGRHIPDDHFKRIFLNEMVWISLECVPKVRINNIPALVQIMAWRRPGDKPLSEPVMFSLLTNICVTRPQWVKGYRLFPVNVGLPLHRAECFLYTTHNCFLHQTYNKFQYNFDASLKLD